MSIMEKVKNVNYTKVLTVLVSGFLGIYFALMAFQAFFDNYRLHFRFPIQSPIWVEKLKHEPENKQKKAENKPVVKEVEAKEEPGTQVPFSEEAIVKSLKNGEVVWKVYGLESTWGKNDYCRANGKGYGGFGVLDNNSKIVCYQSFQEAAERAEYWLVKNGIETDLIDGLCSYNLGHLENGLKHVNCKYYLDYLSL